MAAGVAQEEEAGFLPAQEKLLFAERRKTAGSPFSSESNSSISSITIVVLIVVL